MKKETGPGKFDNMRIGPIMPPPHFTWRAVLAAEYYNPEASGDLRRILDQYENQLHCKNPLIKRHNL